MNLIKNLPNSRLETYLEIILQITYDLAKLWILPGKCPQKLKLNCLRTDKIFFSLLGDKKNFNFGGI